MISKWIGELGFETRVNPFLDYVALAKQINKIDLSQNTLNIINNAYARHKINDNDLHGNSSDGTRHLIFQKNWIDSTDSPEYVLDCFIWLSDSHNMTSLDLVLIHDTANLGKLPESYKYIKSDPKQTIINRNLMIYQTTTGQVSNNNMGIQPSSKIELALTFDAPNITRKSANMSAKEVKSAYDKLSDEDKEIIKNQINKETT